MFNMLVPVFNAILFVFLFSNVRKILADNTIIIYKNNDKNDYKS